MVRPGSPREGLLRQYGAEIVPGHLGDPHSLESACHDASVVLATATGAQGRLPGDTLRSVDRDGMRALVDSARRANVPRFVYMSVSPNLPSSTPLVRYKREIECLVRGSGMAWVVIQPSAFMETWLDRRAGFDAGAVKAVLLGSGEAPVSYVSVRDVAKVTASVTSPLSHVTYTTLPVGGPAALSALDVVRIFEEEIGRRIAVMHVPRLFARGAELFLRRFHPALSSELGIGAYRAASGDVIEPSRLVWEMAGRQVTVRDFARSTARAAFTERMRLLLGGAGGAQV